MGVAPFAVTNLYPNYFVFFSKFSFTLNFTILVVKSKGIGLSKGN